MPPPAPLRLLASLLVVVGAGLPAPADAQLPRPGEVRQLVSFTFLPGRSGEAVELYRAEALPLYEDDADMRSLRVFREAESPVPVELVVVRAFDGMAGMDASNEGLRALAARAGTSIGALYGRIAAMSSGHTDEFVEMLPELGSGDPAASPLTAFVRYRARPGSEAALEAALEEVARHEAGTATPSATGRFLLSDGWTHLRMLGFDSLGAYQAYWAGLRASDVHRRAATLTAARREMILVRVEAFDVRE